MYFFQWNLDCPTIGKTIPDRGCPSAQTSVPKQKGSEFGSPALTKQKSSVLCDGRYRAQTKALPLPFRVTRLMQLYVIRRMENVCGGSVAVRKKSAHKDTQRNLSWAIEKLVIFQQLHVFNIILVYSPRCMQKV